MTTTWKISCLVLATALGVAMGQTRVETNKAELSVPFGVATGHLVAIADHLVFVNSEKPDSSFALDRSNVSDVRVGDQTVTVRTVKPIRDLSEFVFRVSDPTILNALAGWPRGTATVPAKAVVETNEVVQTYTVRHKHTFGGGCTGNLVVSGTRMSYESIDNLGHSRQWDLTNIKELKRTNPYEIEVRPFVGNDYEFELRQKGMSSRDYQLLADTITQQRAPR